MAIWHNLFFPEKGNEVQRALMTRDRYVRAREGSTYRKTDRHLGVVTEQSTGPFDAVGLFAHGSLPAIAHEKGIMVATEADILHRLARRAIAIIVGRGRRLWRCRA